MSRGISCVVFKIGKKSPAKTMTVINRVRLYDGKYKRYYFSTYKRLVHYEGSDLKVGDRVLIYNTKRISAHKSAICYGEKL